MKRQHLKEVQEVLGHSSAAITPGIYSHVIPGRGEGDDIVMDEALS